MNTPLRHRDSTVFGSILSSIFSSICGTILLAFCAAWPGIASACGPAPGGPPATSCTASSPASTGDTGAPDAGAGNPINVITGNKYQREDDMPALPGVLGLEIVRHYNSAYSQPGAPNGPMGREWKLSYETELHDKFGRVQILQADGARVIFDRDPNNPNLCSTALPANGRMTLSRQADGAMEYLWTWTNGRRLRFNRWGKLTNISASTGEAVNLFYDPDNILVKVVDPQGRVLQLNYIGREASRADTRFRGVRYIDSPVGRFAYEYGGEAPKDAVPFDKRVLLADMTRVRLPTRYDADKPAHPLSSRGTTTSAVSRVYHHEDPRFPWLLTGISIETVGADGKPVTTRHATFGYDGNGLANLSTHADNVDRVTLDTREGGKTVLTNSLGQRTVYRHAIVGDGHRLLEVRGAGCSTCGESNVRYAYDRLGRLVETTRLNAEGVPMNATRNELDRLGRTVRISTVDYRVGKPGQVRWRVRFEYRGDGDAPTLIARPSVVPGKERQTRVGYNLAGQPVSVTESGWIPAYDGRQAAARIQRTSTYQYATINGRSLLTRIDGPLPNGPANSPLDSDVTVLEYDHRPNGEHEKIVPVVAGRLEQYNEHEHREGVLTAIIVPGNFKSAFNYDGAGRITTVSNADGRTSSFGYSPRGQLLAVTRDGVTSTTLYDGLGHPIESGASDTAGHHALARMGYDDAGRPVWTASRLGIMATKRYDTEDRVLETSTQSSTIRQARSYTYDPLGRPLAAADVGGGRKSLSWNARDLPDELTDALGRVTRYRYDASDRVVGVVQAANRSDARWHNTETRFELDVNGLPSGVIAPNGATTRYLRDDFGRTVATISSDSGVTGRRFDAADRLISSTDAKGNQAGYEYDAAGRITRQTIIDAGATADRRKTVTTWRYEGKRLAAIDHPEQAERYNYDVQGRLNAKTIVITLNGGAQASYSTRYRYDSLGRLAGISLPDGSMLEYLRNGQGQIVALDRSAVHTPWLRWLLPRQTIVKDLERDVVGLKHLTYGNGIEAIYQRSKEGALARIVYRDPRMTNTARQRGAALEALPGINQAMAALAPNPSAKQLTQPGALALPPDSAALLDHRYLWDVQGNLLHTRDRDAASSYAYDAFDRLIAAGTAPSAPEAAASFNRYYFDIGGNRLLAQEEIASQNDLRGNTVKASYEPDSNRWRGMDAHPEQADIYDAAGQPERIGKRGYVWDALGKLMAVREGPGWLARYRYNQRGERIAKDVSGIRTYYLYDEGRNLLAELDAGGKVGRQYVYLAGQPVAVIDSATGSAGHEEKPTKLAQIGADLKAIWTAWLGHGEAIAYLMNNHLGATELATDVKGKPIWQATYTPLGKVKQSGAFGKRDANALQLNLRLPGQYADRETGLYYNDHRYYDPSRGRYLTPDPLGLSGGGNGYAYANGNPLKYIDPYGLVLFAFDGTGNSETPSPEDSISNVLKFERAYDEAVNGTAYYITGIGTTNEDMPYAGSVISGAGFDERVALGFTFLDRFMAKDSGTGAVDVDVAGFSRGAAEARVWINSLVGKLNGGVYTSDGKSRCVNIRFEGLWDTVPHLGTLHGDESKYDFSIPASVKYAVQAVALNEHRGALDDFTMFSIMGGPGQTSSATRVEKGFIGSHADIGGGFGTGDLSDVALMWMVNQARGQGISIRGDILKDQGSDVVTNPILHDKSSNRFAVGEISTTRKIFYGDGTGKGILETSATVDGKTTADAQADISYFANPYRCGTTINPDVGLVDMTKYNLWLASYGMTMATGPIVNNSCKP